MKSNRRNFITNSISLTATLSVAGLSACTGSDKKESRSDTAKKVKWPVIEGPSTPKLCVGGGMNADEKQM
jgi:hypothetical protein